MKNMGQREAGRKGQGIPDAEEKGSHTQVDKHRKMPFQANTSTATVFKNGRVLRNKSERHQGSDNGSSWMPGH